MSQLTSEERFIEEARNTNLERFTKEEIISNFIVLVDRLSARCESLERELKLAEEAYETWVDRLIKKENEDIKKLKDERASLQSIVCGMEDERDVLQSHLSSLLSAVEPIIEAANNTDNLHLVPVRRGHIGTLSTIAAGIREGK